MKTKRRNNGVQAVHWLAVVLASCLMATRWRDLPREPRVRAWLSRWQRTRSTDDARALPRVETTITEVGIEAPDAVWHHATPATIDDLIKEYLSARPNESTEPPHPQKRTWRLVVKHGRPVDLTRARLKLTRLLIITCGTQQVVIVVLVAAGHLGAAEGAALIGAGTAGYGAWLRYALRYFFGGHDRP